MSDILEIVELMKTNGSKNIAFLQYILELITFKYENSEYINTKEMLDYANILLTFVRIWCNSTKRTKTSTLHAQ